MLIAQAMFAYYSIWQIFKWKRFSVTAATNSMSLDHLFKQPTRQDNKSSSPASSITIIHYTQQHPGVVGVETFKRCLAQASPTSIEDPSPAVEVNAAKPSPLRVTSACDQQLDCNKEKSADRFPLNRDVPKEDRNHADHTRSDSMASCTSQPKFSRVDQDDGSSEIHQSNGLVSWWETTGPTDLHDPGDVAAEEDWSGAISTPHEYDRSNAIDGQYEGWRVDENLDIPFIYPHPEDLIYGLEEATAAWLGRPIGR
ncbi:hypothetical protein M434DRAFT_133223 [Hypoxylon sp. CO27-5]|nr:hypothetical protein M434DRAFT_133223 [Hypoxylon sp. CO27-5]